MYLFPIRMLTGKNVVNWICIIRSSKKVLPRSSGFTGGGLEGGGKEIPPVFQGRKIAVAGVNYRLSPRATHPAYIDDAAAAVAWVMKHIGEYGGDPTRVYVAGHSAGGYLTLMVGLDKAYLARYGEDADRLAGLFPVSGQTNTHFTIRKERNIPVSYTHLTLPTILRV